VPDKAGTPGDVICTAILPSAGQPNQSVIKIIENGHEKTTTVNLFDHLRIEIQAQMIEFRRSIDLHFRGCLDVNTLTGEGVKGSNFKLHNAKGKTGQEKAETLDLNSAVKSSKGNKRNKK
jgi:hypothetical protein